MPSPLLSQMLSGLNSSKEVGERGAKVGGGEWVDRLVEVQDMVVWVAVVDCFLVECFFVDCFFVLVGECLAVVYSDVNFVIELFGVLVVLIVELSGILVVEASVVELSIIKIELSSVTTLVTSVVGLTPSADEVEISAFCQSLQGAQSPH